MLRRLAARLVAAILNRVMRGKTIMVLAENKTISWTGYILSVSVSKDDVVALFLAVPDGDQQGYCYLAFSPHIKWNPIAQMYEIEERHGLVWRRRRYADDTLGLGADSARDRPPSGEEPEHREGSPETPGPSTTPHGRPDGESQGGALRGHDDLASSEGPEVRAVGPGQDSGSGHARHTGAVIRIGVHNGLPTGLLVGVDSLQRIYLHKIGEVPPEMPDGTLVWANAITVAHIQHSARRNGVEPMTMQ